MGTTEAQRRAIEARRTEVAKLIHRKFSIRAIARQLGVNVQTAHADVQAVRAEWKAERDREMTEHFAEELDLLARLQAMVLPLALDEASLSAADRALNISESRRKLLGLDAPAKSAVEHSGPSGGPIAIREVVVELTKEVADADPEHLAN